jgi:glycerophosphoryl diester phosphodiesterase
MAQKHGFESLVFHHEGVTPEKTAKVAAAGFEVGAWTVNDADTMKRMLDAGVERIYTDHPLSLLSLKAERLKSKNSWPVSRLLINPMRFP